MDEGSKIKANTPFYKKWWFWVVIAVLLICVVAAGASSKKDPQKVGDDASSEQQDQQSKKDEEKTFRVGDVIAVENQEMTVVSVERNWSSEYSKPKDGKEYIIVTVKLENKSDDKLSYTSGDWDLEDGDGAISNPAFVLGNDNDISYGELAAGGKKSGTIVYEIPAGDTNLKIHYKPSLFSSRDVIVEL